MEKNLLYYGDNLDVLRRHLKDDSVDLVYLDPPFKSNQDYNILFEEKSGAKAAAQIKAFEDTWDWDQPAEDAYREITEHPGRLADVMRAFMTFLGRSEMMAYLSMMAPRLAELRRVLKATGSIYLHCDSTASAHLRILTDAVFGPKNFRNEIIWYYYNKMHDRRKRLFPRASDTVLFYVKDVQADFTYYQLKEKRENPVRQLARKKVEGRMVNVKDEHGRLVYRTSTERTLDNVWRIPCLQPAAREKLGYPTQKPEALLDRILRASSNRGDLVLDPFCGCGTTIVVAQKLGRRWIGIDITQAAIVVIKNRLQDTFSGQAAYNVIGEPVDLGGAEALARDDPYQFQWWVLGRVGARPDQGEERKGPDAGIDGRRYFYDDNTGRAKTILFSVKAGHVTVAHVRDLRGVIDREKAEMGVFLCMERPTKQMRKEAVSAGVYQILPGRTRAYPRLQIMTVEELLDGKSVQCPFGEDPTFKRAPKVAAEPTETPELPFSGDPDQ